MRSQEFSPRFLALATLFVAFAVIGCDSKKSESTTAAPTSTEAVVAKLAKADAVDGKTDKVVGKCAGCSLGMDGKADHVLAVHGYQMHFCSDDCKKTFEKDPDKAILAMKGAD